jgi:hypothetical protein
MKTIREWPIFGAYILLGVLLLSGSRVSANTNNITVQLGPAAPASLLVSTGQTVVIMLTNMPSFPSPPDFGPVYQWFQNDYPIDSATNSSYTIYSAGLADAATYYAFVNGQSGTAQSAPLNLGVYFQYHTNSNGGSLAYPIGNFSFKYQQLPCSPKQFDYYYNVPYLFYGSNVTSQSGPFTNSSNRLLDLSTCVSANGSTLDTGIVLKMNGPPFTTAGCSDDAGAACASDSSLSMFTATLNASTAYRFTIFCNTNALNGLTNITFSWFFHN